jgi:outer membrane protein OmpA-like peptidoglycan-associated protein
MNYPNRNAGENVSKTFLGYSYLFVCFVASGLLLVSPSVEVGAQSFVSPNVIIDESVLDELGPPPNLPGLMLKGGNDYRSVPPHYTRHGYTQGAPRRLLPAPRRMPRSKVTAPRHLVRPAPLPRAKPRRSVTPRREIAKGPGVLGQVRQSEVDNLGRSPASLPVAPTATRSRAAPSPRIPTPLVSRAAPSIPIVPALPKSAEQPSAPPQVVVPLPPAVVPQVTPPVASRVVVPSAPAVAPPSDRTATAPRVMPPSVFGDLPPSPPVMLPPGRNAARSRLASFPTNVPPAAVRLDGQNFTVNFAKDATDMPPGVTPFLSGLIKELKADQSIRLQLKGYAGSAEGSPGQARRVSLFRALSVRKYLIKQGIRSTRMDIRALGSKVKKGKPDRVDIEVKK